MGFSSHAVAVGGPAGSTTAINSHSITMRWTIFALLVTISQLFTVSALPIETFTGDSSSVVTASSSFLNETAGEDVTDINATQVFTDPVGNATEDATNLDNNTVTSDFGNVTSDDMSSNVITTDSVDLANGTDNFENVPDPDLISNLDNSTVNSSDVLSADFTNSTSVNITDYDELDNITLTNLDNSTFENSTSENSTTIENDINVFDNVTAIDLQLDNDTLENNTTYGNNTDTEEYSDTSLVIGLLNETSAIDVDSNETDTDNVNLLNQTDSGELELQNDTYSDLLADDVVYNNTGITTPSGLINTLTTSALFENVTLSTDFDDIDNATISEGFNNATGDIILNDEIYEDASDNTTNNETDSETLGDIVGSVIDIIGNMTDILDGGNSAFNDVIDNSTDALIIETAIFNTPAANASTSNDTFMILNTGEVLDYDVLDEDLGGTPEDEVLEEALEYLADADDYADIEAFEESDDLMAELDALEGIDDEDLSVSLSDNLVLSDNGSIANATIDEAGGFHFHS